MARPIHPVTWPCWVWPKSNTVSLLKNTSKISAPATAINASEATMKNRRVTCVMLNNSLLLRQRPHGPRKTRQRLLTGSSALPRILVWFPAPSADIPRWPRAPIRDDRILPRKWARSKIGICSRTSAWFCRLSKNAGGGLFQHPTSISRPPFARPHDNGDNQQNALDHVRPSLSSEGFGPDHCSAPED